MPIQQSFENFLAKQINLSLSQISQGSKSHTHIRDLLNNKWQTDDKFPWLTDGDFLSGSYRRGTKLHPLDDIDVMIILDGQGLFPIKGGYQINAYVRGGEKLGSPVVSYTDKNGYISSNKILEIFRDGIKESYPESTIRKDGQAINVWFESYGLGLDIVPSFHIIPNDGSRDYYYIPFGGNSSMWKSTNPKIDEEICNEINEKHNKKLKPLIKLLKYWNREINNDRLRSYHLEVIIWKIFSSHPSVVKDFSYAIKYFFDNVEGYFTTTCGDPTNLGENVDSYLEQQKRNESINLTKATKIAVDRALAFEYSGNITDSLNEWRKIYGEQFGK